jgi:hypothetical protein
MNSTVSHEDVLLTNFDQNLAAHAVADNASGTDYGTGKFLEYTVDLWDDLFCSVPDIFRPP